MILFAILINISLYKIKINQFSNTIELQKSEKKFQKLFEFNPYPLIIVQYSDGFVLDYNKKAMAFFEKDLQNYNTEDLFPFKKIKQKFEENPSENDNEYNDIQEIMVNG